MMSGQRPGGLSELLSRNAVFCLPSPTHSTLCPASSSLRWRGTRAGATARKSATAGGDCNKCVDLARVREQPRKDGARLNPYDLDMGKRDRNAGRNTDAWVG